MIIGSSWPYVTASCLDLALELHSRNRCMLGSREKLGLISESYTEQCFVCS